MNTVEKFVQGCDRINYVIILWCSRFATTLLAVLAITVFGGVLARFVFNSPFGWTEEFAKYCMVWLTFIGAPVVMVRGSHVAVDLLHAYLSPKVLHGLRLAIAILCAVILVLFIRYGWHAALSARSQTILIMNGVSMFWLYVSVPLGSAIYLFAISIRVLKEVLYLCDPHFQEKPLFPES